MYFFLNSACFPTRGCLNRNQLGSQPNREVRSRIANWNGERGNVMLLSHMAFSLIHLQLVFGKIRPAICQSQIYIYSHLYFELKSFCILFKVNKTFLAQFINKNLLCKQQSCFITIALQKPFPDIQILRCIFKHLILVNKFNMYQ